MLPSDPNCQRGGTRASSGRREQPTCVSTFRPHEESRMYDLLTCVRCSEAVPSAKAEGEGWKIGMRAWPGRWFHFCGACREAFLEGSGDGATIKSAAWDVLCARCGKGFRLDPECPDEKGGQASPGRDTGVCAGCRRLCATCGQEMAENRPPWWTSVARAGVCSPDCLVGHSKPHSGTEDQRNGSTGSGAT